MYTEYSSHIISLWEARLTRFTDITLSTGVVLFAFGLLWCLDAFAFCTCAEYGYVLVSTLVSIHF